MGNKPDWVGQSYKKNEILKMADGSLRPEIGNGLAPYGGRHSERLSDPFEAKGKGYFGLMKSKDGMSTEISSDNGEFSYPLMVPTLTRSELNLLLEGKEPTDAIYDKAEAHARKRIEEGKSPFAGNGDLIRPPPEE